MTCIVNHPHPLQAYSFLSLTLSLSSFPHTQTIPFPSFSTPTNIRLQFPIFSRSTHFPLLGRQSQKMRFSHNTAPSSDPDQVPMFPCKPNRPCSPINNSSEQLIMMSSQQNSENHHRDHLHHHHHHHEDLQITMIREQKDQYCSERDRLKRHREEVAGRVVVPDTWGKEELMKDWIDYSSFDKLLVPSGIGSAREALVMEARRRQAASSSTTTSQRPRIESRC